MIHCICALQDSPPSQEDPVDAEDDDGHGDADTPGHPVDEEEDAVHHNGLASVKLALFWSQFRGKCPFPPPEKCKN